MVFDIYEVPKVENAGLEHKTYHKGSTQEMACFDNEVIKYQRIRINSNIKDLDKPMIQNKILELIRKYESILRDGIFEIFIRTQCKGEQNQKIIYTRILIFTSEERFDVSAEHRHIKLSFIKALFKLEAKLTKKEPSIECGPNRYPNNISDNINSKVLSHKIIFRKTQNEGVVIEN